MKKSAAIVSDAYLPKKKTLATQLKTNLPLLIMLLPGFVALLLFHYKPIYGLLIAFKDYKFWAARGQQTMALNTLSDFLAVMNF